MTAGTRIGAALALALLTLPGAAAAQVGAPLIDGLGGPFGVGAPKDGGCAVTPDGSAPAGPWWLALLALAGRRRGRGDRQSLPGGSSAR